ncbi:hypothetical protein VNO77_21135 [Canavalia gladiata]|uniref:Uncharacterized protein n=1 Tax=Canavalia gladiata TaxID=3824 RepID=A0AAN9LVL2_CANGL
MAKVRGGPLSPAAHVSPSPSPKRWWPPHPPTSLIQPHIPPHFNHALTFHHHTFSQTKSRSPPPLTPTSSPYYPTHPILSFTQTLI